MSCASPIPVESLRDYFAGELSPDESAKLEEHVFECNACADRYDQEGALSVSLVRQIPPVISHEKLKTFERTGLALRRYRIPPGQPVDVRFAKGLALLINALEVDADDADRVDLAITDLSGQPITELAAVPFDRGSGEVLIACQRHFGEIFPSDVRFEVFRVKGEKRESAGRYEIHHAWE